MPALAGMGSSACSRRPICVCRPPIFSLKIGHEGDGRLTVSIASIVSRLPKSAGRRFAGWSRAGLLVLLLSVFFQSYIAQTHIHRSGTAAELSSALSLSALADFPRDPSSPADDDHGNCVLCHAALQAGAFFVSDAVVFLLPALLFLGLAAAFVHRDASPILASHGWRSRAPPVS